MKREKTFDAVTMKHQIQQKLAEEFRNIPENEARKIQMKRVAQNPIIGDVLRRVRTHTTTTTNK